MHVLGIDVGTASVKAAVLDVAAETPVGELARAAYELDHPTPEAAEVPPERLWSAVTMAAREAVRKTAGAGSSVAGVGLSCLTPALVLLDGADQPAAPIWTPLDRRARPAARQVWKAVGDEFLQTVGSRPLPSGVSVLGYRRQLHEDPYLSHRVKSYLHINGWLTLRLTGARAFDPGNASCTGLYGTLTDRAWSPRWCDYFEVDLDWLPPVVSGDATVGTLRSAAAAQLGVPAGLPVKLGIADLSSAMRAVGMTAGDLMHVVGTTQVLAAFTDDPKPGPQRLTRQLGVGERFIHVTHNPVGGVALDWVRNLCFQEQDEQEFYDQTIPAARDRQTRVTLHPPFLDGDCLEIEAARAAFRDLTLKTDRMDLLAAVLQALVQRHREALKNLGMGESFQRLFLTGGGAEVIHRLIPEYAGVKVHPFKDGSLRGIAQLFRQ